MKIKDEKYINTGQQFLNRKRHLITYKMLLDNDLT